jgi:protein-S-isoprenylcysteine O-methyltransferase Ste14
VNIFIPANAVFFACMVVYSGIRRHFIRKLGLMKTPKAVSLFDRQEKWLLFGMGVAVLLLPVIYLFTPLLNFANYLLPPYVPWIGFAVIVASLWLFWRSHADLARSWSVSLEVCEGHQLVTHGVYRRIRHPMYASIWLWTLGQGLMLPNWFAGWAAVIAFAAMYFLRIPREEQLMCDTFGQEYRNYMTVTGRLLPRLGRSSSRPSR